MLILSPAAVTTSSIKVGDNAPSTSASAPTDARVVECEHADRCGGCPAIALPYGEQLLLKRARLETALGRFPDVGAPAPLPIVGADAITAYRTRAKLIVAPGGKLGLFGKGGGHQVVDIPHCRVLSPVLARVADVLRRHILEDERSSGPLAPYDPPSGGALRAVDLRETRSDNQPPRVLVTFVVQRTQITHLDALRHAARVLAENATDVVGVAANFHDGDVPQILGNETTVLYGVGSSPDTVGASSHFATFGSFVQAHRGQAANVHALVAQALGLPRRGKEPSPRVLDLYGGSGAIALGLAALGANVHMVESFAPAVASALAAAQAQHLTVTAEHGDVAGALRAFADRAESFDAAVVNPPRRGMSPAARDCLARVSPTQIVYVSCDPDTLTRDLDHLRRVGYAATSITPLDMIPLTDEVETVAVLATAPLPLPRVVHENEEMLVVEKAAHEPTMPQGEYTTSLVARARRIPGAESAIPVHRLDVGSSGLVLLARDAKVSAKWTEIWNAPTTRKVFVVAVRGVTPSKGAITRDLREEGKLYPARTRYRRLAVASGHSVLRVIPEQGRTHQVRRHLAAIGHPVLGDDRYGHAPTNRFFEEKNGLDRAFVHCVRIEYDDPISGHRMILEAPLPGDLRAVIERTSGVSTLKFLDHKNALGTGLSTFPPPPDVKNAEARAAGESKRDPARAGAAGADDEDGPLDVDAKKATVRPEMTDDDQE